VADHGWPASPGTPRVRPSTTIRTAPPSLAETVSSPTALYEIDSPGPSDVVGCATPSIVAVTSTPAVALTMTPTPGPGVGDTNGVVAVGIVAGGGSG